MSRSTEPGAASAGRRSSARGLAGAARFLLTGDLLGFTSRIPLPEPLRRPRLELGLLMSRRPGVFLAAAVVSFILTLAGAALGGGREASYWPSLVVAPMVLLGAPLLSDVVAVERRSGSLDLALAAPGARFLFERRLAVGLTCLLAQAWLGIVIAWVDRSMTFALAPPLTQALLLCALLGAGSLFWGVRLQTPGAVLLATVATIGVLNEWSMWPPIPDSQLPGRFLPPWRECADWGTTSAVLAGASLLLYLHARRRLSRPETLLR